MNKDQRKLTKEETEIINQTAKNGYWVCEYQGYNYSTDELIIENEYAFIEGYETELIWNLDELLGAA